MPVCVECGASVATLYTEYGKGNIRLTKCDGPDGCGRFADKYLENDFVIVFIDMVLHRRSVYRHLLLNAPRRSDGLHRADVKWFRLEKHIGPSSFPRPEAPLYLQYMCMLALCAIEFTMWHLGVRMGVRILKGPGLALAEYHRISSAVVVSSFGKLLLIVMVIWDYNELQYSWLISILVMTSNAEALSVYLQMGYYQTILVLVFGRAMKLATQMAIASFDPRLQVLIL
ncbi:Arv1-like family-domain-containing protein [Blyttiomyces helicus]|uniref:Protein ARV n=1 Tax=Blyttiomyces helicus TaxID=388810 RepID=A0A4P9WTW9_9FUNG|nr:Arv1-like family-domain-containing protein [Blyttiomyces helicus]|eukprot:RKO94546.1 Arv1-like family-domain-containing protein [Blyttiomyces helicus]